MARVKKEQAETVVKKPRAKSATKKTAEPKPVIVHGFKGFDKNMQCRGMQYEVGKTYEEQKAVMCDVGIHYCDNPLHVLGYYPAGQGNKYSKIEDHNPNDQRKEDSKRVTTKLSVSAEINLSSLIKAGVDFVWKAATAKKDASTGYEAHNASTGERAHNASTGNWAHNASTGNWAHSVGAGNHSSCEVKGKNSIAAALGRKGRCRACAGAWIVLAEYTDDGEILAIRSAQIDGEILNPDTYYMLKNGEFVEA